MIQVECLKEWIDIIQSVITIIAVIVSGFWGYWLFVKNRQKYPRADIEHHVTHRLLGNDKILVHVNTIINNLGTVLLNIISLETRIQQIIPVPNIVNDKLVNGVDPVNDGETEILWPLLQSRDPNFEKGGCEIEPGERQEIQFDYIISENIKTVAIYSYVKNKKKRGREIGWDSTMFYDLE